MTAFGGTNQKEKDMYKSGQKIIVRLADGKVKKAVFQEYAPDLFHTHTHTHTHLLVVKIGAAEKVIDEKAIVEDEKTTRRH